jgi:hypothetical protein
MPESFKPFSKQLNKTRKLYAELKKNMETIHAHHKNAIQCAKYYSANPKKYTEQVMSDQKEYLDTIRALKKDMNTFRSSDFVSSLENLDKDFVDECKENITKKKQDLGAK